MPDLLGPAWRYAFLVPYPASAAFRTSEVLTIPLGTFRYVPLFRSSACMARWIGEYLTHGGGAGLVAAPTPTALASLLEELRGAGVTHIAIDPEPEGCAALTTIERAIMCFAMHGGVMRDTPA